MSDSENSKVGSEASVAGSETRSGDIIKRLIAGANIMMVDDEQLNMDVLRLHLENEGYQHFICVSDSRKALNTLRSEMPDVLLLDLVMPEVSGFQILAEIRSDRKLAQLPVIVLTSAGDAETKHQALKLGATDFLAKPIDASELALRMRNTLMALAGIERRHRIDDLTGLPNRNCFNEYMKQKFGVLRTSGRSLAMVLININRFKSINDSLGPARGDEVLRRFSARLREYYGAIDSGDWSLSDHASVSARMLARLDGDRFALLISSEAETEAELQEDLAPSLQAIRDTVAEPFEIAGEKIFLTISMGISTIDRNSASIDSLINNAETAMQFAKATANNDHAFYSSHMDARARQLLSLENGLRTAIDNGEMFVVYQPKVSLPCNRIAGAEALLRWQHPEHGIVSPTDFIPMAENLGNIVRIGQWVLEQAAAQTVIWQKTLTPDFSMAVNVSIRQLYEPDFLEHVERILRDTRLAPHHLTLELTENMLMHDVERNVEILEALRVLGVRISIDDFGTGYSSLSYLQRFPVDQLKIDRSFIHEIQSPDDFSPIVKAVTSLAHDLGLDVVAEGIETHAQRDYVNSLSCERYQGYLCSAPLMAAEFAELFRNSERLAG
ncbi:MAG: GGDEF domain-containing response regulator [Gammaproteobacteria bacterium]|nr:MAG: GGDEF domain-containing response regulator [Gammaproteobacteria bacterium]